MEQLKTKLAGAQCAPFVSQLSGVGLCATQQIVTQSKLFREEPIICGQYSWGIVYGYEACHHCLKSLETPVGMLQRLSKDKELTLPIADHMPSVDVSSFAFCPGCKVMFCSDACLKTALAQYHTPVCTNGEPDHPLVKLDELWRNMHYPPETTSLVMIIKIIGLSITSGKIPEIFGEFYQAVENRGNTHKVLKPEFISQLDLLRDGLLQIFGSNSLVQQLLLRENFISLIALIGMNGQGIGTSSFADYCKRLEELPLTKDDKDNLDRRIEVLYDKMDEEVGIFRDVEGTGLYALQSKLNHSCDPNVQIVFSSSNHVLSVEALRDIPKGEELCISYLSCCQLESSRHSRRKVLLENYLFECECGKCRAQINDPDVTSDEEEYDSDEEMEC